jgi:hypothetical protein
MDDKAGGHWHFSARTGLHQIGDAFQLSREKRRKVI